MKVSRFFAAANKGKGVVELLCYDVIGQNWDGSGITAANFSKALKDAGAYDSISLRINSPGGDAFEGVAIMNLLRATGKPIAVNVDGLAASAASIIAMAGDTVTMGEGSMLMIHNAWSFAMGNADELRKTAETLDKVSQSIAQTYQGKTGRALAEIESMMSEETWLSADDAVQYGFADAVAKLPSADDAKAKALRNSFDLTVFSKAPKFEAAPAAEAEAEAETESEVSASEIGLAENNLQHFELRLRAKRLGSK